MGSWHGIGKIEPVVGEWRFFEREVTGIMFRLSCAPLPDGSPSYLWLREWRNSKPGIKQVIYPKIQQTFNFGESGNRLIEVCKLYPHWARDIQEEPYQIGLEEWVDEPVEEPVKPWVGYH